MKAYNIFDEYFKTQGINTRYNTLGYTSQMVVSYVHETRDIVGKKQSNLFKPRCYSQYYDMMERPKYTGFEWVSEEDYIIREKLYKVIDKDQTREQYFLDDTVPELDYLTLLKESLPIDGNNLLYLSGGIDSEMAALAMLDADVKFTPIILRYTRNGRVVNSYDTIYATEFCVNHLLSPYYYNIDVLAVWETPEFIDLAIELGSVSPQQGLYAHAVHEINKIFPDSLHMFGGEIRYLSDVEAEDNKLADLVMMAKTTPGYSGKTYESDWPSGNPTAYTGMSLYYSNNGTWRIGMSSGGPIVTRPITGTPVSGTYTTTPGFSYQVISAITTYTPGNPQTNVAVTSAWTTITGLDYTVCKMDASGSGGASGSVNITVQCRGTISPATVVTSTIRFEYH